MDGDDAGAIVGCLFVLGAVALKVLIVVALAYIVLHFAFKYW